MFANLLILIPLLLHSSFTISLMGVRLEPIESIISHLGYLSREKLVRRLVRIDGVMMLVPDNPKYPPLQPSADLQIVGVAVEAIKRVEL